MNERIIMSCTYNDEIFSNFINKTFFFSYKDACVAWWLKLDTMMRKMRLSNNGWMTHDSIDIGRCQR